MLRAQEDASPDWGDLSLWNCHQLTRWFRILSRLALAKPPKASSPYPESRRLLPEQAGIAAILAQGRWRPHPNVLWGH